MNNKELSGKVPANNPLVTSNAESKHKIVRTEALVRKTGVAGFDGMKMVAELEQGHLGIYYYVETRSYGMYEPWATT